MGVKGMTVERKENGSRRNRRRMTLLKLMMSLFVTLLILPLATAGVQAALGDVVLVSADAAGVQGGAGSFAPQMSSDGRYVAFYSTATNLVTPNTTGVQDFRKDLRTGEVRLVSADAAGVQGNGVSSNPVISSDGRYVAFYSTATNLVTPATSGNQVFRKDMLTGEVKLVSADTAGVQGNGASSYPAISDDGRYVAFLSSATNLLIPATTGQQIFRKDLVTGEIKLASANPGGVYGNGNAMWNPDISSNGRYVVFTSESTNLVTPATSGRELFSKDMLTGEVKLASSNAAGLESDNNNGYPSYSSDGRYVSFASVATNLVTPATTGQQVFRKDLLGGEVVLVSANAAGTQGTGMGGSATYPSTSADGRYVAFDSSFTNLVTPATSGTQIFRKDLVTGEVVLGSTNAAGTQGNGNSQYSSLTPDGRYVAFYSFSTNLVTPATANAQIFRKELAAPYYFYFAEGYTGSGFQEYLCLGNPVPAPLAVKTTYLYKDGTTKEDTYNVPGNSRSTINVNLAAGADKEVSIKCESASPFIAERPMYFNYQNKWTGGHDALGARAPSLAWYFAEGYTGAGFDEYICVLNPGDTPANLTFYFQTQEEGEIINGVYTVGAHTRDTFKMNDFFGGKSIQNSLKLVSDRLVVAERPMYFSYSGTGGYAWTGGSCVMGAPMLSSSYFFAEGTTRAGFEEWLTIQNPWASDITVHAVYNLGSGVPVERDYPVQGGRRSTILVNSASIGVGAEKDVSVLLSCTSPFLAERPMYFDYRGLGNWGWTGGHCVIGANSPANEWYFAEGYTGQYFEEWLCIQNPGAAAANLTVTYYPEGGGAPITRTHAVGGNTRYTIPVNVDAGTNLAISAKVSSNVPVIVERPMYFNFQGKWSGGHDVVGYVP
jgi:Tol biopolymer transport system component